MSVITTQTDGPLFIHNLKVVGPFFDQVTTRSPASLPSAVTFQRPSKDGATPPRDSAQDGCCGTASIPEVVSFIYLTSGAKFARLGNTDRVRLVPPCGWTEYRTRQKDDSIGPPFERASEFERSLLQDQDHDGPNLDDFQFHTDPRGNPPGFLLHFTLSTADHLTERFGEWLEERYQACEGKSMFKERQVTNQEEFEGPYPPFSMVPVTISGSDSLVDDRLRFDHREWLREMSEAFGEYTMGEAGALEWDDEEQALVCTLSPPAAL
ncbi:hypothetical protein I302_101301 [Kwoniella bestiolae CBS 10118]|uniref:Uncharacterized protein n=1 Tax=Kwoniella bestiolae CBS 10118 TaxID=1296100 RepID=A0A1B9G7J6_9TREE|nr:hypothetical protein I302_04675 [Kwoniella bestiolae CBS 10118]OCF26983.1 hypothetical protein I302_04675 [Kwoniella bestiolae CBS 10118]